MQSCCFSLDLDRTWVRCQGLDTSQHCIERQGNVRENTGYGLSRCLEAKSRFSSAKQVMGISFLEGAG